MYPKTTNTALTYPRATPRPTRFSLAANYDLALVPKLAAYPVDEVYGKFPNDGINGGRPNYLSSPLSEEDLRHYTRVPCQGVEEVRGNRRWVAAT